MILAIVRTYRDAYGGLPRDVWLMAFTLFINRTGTMVLPFLTLYLVKEFGFQESAAGLMLSVYGLGSILGAYLGGRYAEKVGAIRLQTICLFLTVPAYLAIPLFTSWWGIAVALFILSVICESVRPINATAIAKLSSNEQLTKSFALQRMAANLGVSFGPAIGGFLTTVNYYWLFVGDAVTTLCGAFLFLYFFRMKRIPPRHVESQEGNLVETSQTKKPTSPSRDLKFLIFLGLMLAMSLVFFQFQSTYPLYLTSHYQLKETQLGLLYAVNTIVIVLFEMVFVNYIRRFPILLMIGAGAFLSCLGFGILPFGSTGWFAVISMLILTVGEMSAFPLSSGFVAVRSVGANQGMYMGYYTMTFSIAAVAGPFIGSYCYEIDKALIWYVSFGIGCVVWIGFTIMYFFERALLKKRQTANGAPVHLEQNS